MEGGYLPWKNLTSDVVDQVDAVGKPLPPPPAGHIWSRESSGSWVLRDAGRMQKATADVASSTTPKEPVIIEHVVMPEDTLQGICLRYRVSVMEVRRINLFSGDHIQCKKSLRIPLTKGVTITGQENTNDVLLQKFRNETNESTAEARIYLEDNNWDVEAAIRSWKADENWENTRYLETLARTIPSLGMSTAVDDGAGASAVPKRTMFASTVDSVHTHTAVAAPVAIRVPKEVAPFTVIEMSTFD